MAGAGRRYADRHENRHEDDYGDGHVDGHRVGHGNGHADGRGDGMGIGMGMENNLSLSQPHGYIIFYPQLILNPTRMLSSIPSLISNNFNLEWTRHAIAIGRGLAGYELCAGIEQMAAAGNDKNGNGYEDGHVMLMGMSMGIGIGMGVEKDMGMGMHI